MELVHFHRFAITSKCNTELITNTKNKTICYATTTFSLCSQFSFFGIYQWQNNVAEAQFLKEKIFQTTTEIASMKLLEENAYFLNCVHSFLF